MCPHQYTLPLDQTEERKQVPAKVKDEEVIATALRILRNRHRPGRLLNSPESTRDFLTLWLSERPNEMFGCIFLDNRHRVLAVEELFQGTIDGASVHPRVVIQEAIAVHNAAAVILFHNHPSGIVDPSQADLRITQRLKDALAMVEVRVLDHVIVGFEGSISFAERGLL